VPATSAQRDFTEAPNPRRWLVLAVVATAQLMVVFDVTIVNVALPSAQQALGFADTDRQWIITAYALAFGSLLLLGGRIGDLFGRKRAFIIGLAGFAGASAVGGTAGSFAVLVSARAVQGVFAALLAPTALAVVATTFTGSAARGKAYGIFAAVATGGSAVGLILGGVLTEELSWRFCLYVNLLFAAVAGIGALVVLDNGSAQRARLDIPGTVLASTGLFAIVFGFSHASTSAWTDPLTIGALAAGVVVLAGFVLVQQRVAHPLLPLRVVLDRNRGGSYLSVAVSAIAIFGVFLFLTYYFQQVKDYSPIITGLAFLPLTAATVTASVTSNIALLPRLGPRPLVSTGMLLGAAGMVLLSRVGADSGYAASVLPALIILGLAFGFTFGPAINAATARVHREDAGAASGLANTMQQVGGATGTALLSTLAAGATTTYLSDHRSHGHAVVSSAAVHGYQIAYLTSAGIFLAGAIIAVTLLRGRPAPHPGHHRDDSRDSPEPAAA
jgi:EmrB/QacA subfamily drug resistance transporter